MSDLLSTVVRIDTRLAPSQPVSRRTAAGLARLLPGSLLSAGVAIAAMALQRAEQAVFGRAWLEALVLAILVGTAVRSVWTPGPPWSAGIRFSAKTVLEVAVLLLGASVSFGMIGAAGPVLLIGIALVVVLAIGASYAIGRLLGLRRRMAMLVACGNSICGNSAIAAVAPVIGADGEEVAASIAFTAVLGVVVVLVLPFLPAVLHLTRLQGGQLAGLTVYAVPQVMAAAAPLGAAAMTLGTLVKLVRVLMLGPVVLGLSLLARGWRDETGAEGEGNELGWRTVQRLVPWFIVGFLGLATLRSAGMIPCEALAPAAAVANLLTVVSMAALGLDTDLRAVARAGGRVTAAVTLSLLVLGAISVGLIRIGAWLG